MEKVVLRNGEDALRELTGNEFKLAYALRELISMERMRHDGVVNVSMTRLGTLTGLTERVLRASRESLLQKVDIDHSLGNGAHCPSRYNCSRQPWLMGNDADNINHTSLLYAKVLLTNYYVEVKTVIDRSCHPAFIEKTVIGSDAFFAVAEIRHECTVLANTINLIFLSWEEQYERKTKEPFSCSGWPQEFVLRAIADVLWGKIKDQIDWLTRNQADGLVKTWDLLPIMPCITEPVFLPAGFLPDDEEEEDVAESSSSLDISDTARRIIEFWNTDEEGVVPTIKVLDMDVAGTALDMYMQKTETTEEEMMQAIRNYLKVQGDPFIWFKRTMKLTDLLNEMDRFHPKNFAAAFDIE